MTYREAMMMKQAAGRAPTWNEFLQLVQHNETGGIKHPDYATSRPSPGRQDVGRYQISPAYWRDAMGKEAPVGRANPTLAAKAVNNYMLRYGPGRAGTWGDLLRIHNGGPKGASMNATKAYLDKARTKAAEMGVDLDAGIDWGTVPGYKAKPKAAR